MKNKKLKILILILVILLGALGFAYQKVKNFADRPINVSSETIFTLPAGTGRVVLETLLIDKKLMKPNPWFPWLLRLEPELSEFKAGTYRFEKGMTIRQMLVLLKSGKEAQFSMRFVEGFKLSDWMKLLQNSPYVKHELTGKSGEEIAAAIGVKDTTNAEGWLYPDT